MSSHHWAHHWASRQSQINDSWTKTGKPSRNAAATWAREYAAGDAAVCCVIDEYIDERKTSKPRSYYALLEKPDAGGFERLGKSDSFTGAVRICDRAIEHLRAIRAKAN